MDFLSLFYFCIYTYNITNHFILSISWYHAPHTLFLSSHKSKLFRKEKNEFSLFIFLNIKKSIINHFYEIKKAKKRGYRNPYTFLGFKFFKIV